MQKLLFIMSVIVTANSQSAFEGFQSTPASLKKEAESVIFLEAEAFSTKKSIPQVDFQQDGEIHNIDEYDQNITDNVKPPVIGPVQAMCQEILAGLLIRYITIQQTAHNYLKIIKNALTQWYLKLMEKTR